mmetsp:Transcript_748/g.1819  ORF Transcript_748/g.1819 Transcript_748/m.1819 type:complete len:87 (+) Transcript_748:391-651(+)
MPRSDIGSVASFVRKMKELSILVPPLLRRSNLRGMDGARRDREDLWIDDGIIVLGDGICDLYNWIDSYSGDFLWRCSREAQWQVWF